MYGGMKEWMRLRTGAYGRTDGRTASHNAATNMIKVSTFTAMVYMHDDHADSAKNRYCMLRSSKIRN
jgi:hypothetical protein